MGVAKPLGLVLAIVMGFLAVSQVDALQQVGESITSGSLKEFLSTTTFLVLLVVVVIAVGGLIGVLKMLSGR